LKTREKKPTNAPHFAFQKSKPDMVFKLPMRRKNGMHTVAIVAPKYVKKCWDGISVIPKTDVTKVSGRKNIETFFES
jgi:hypothetical protein